MIKSFSKLAVGALALAVFFAEASAAVWMPRIFSSNMVLQRDMKVKIWGSAEANSTIEVSFAGKSQKTKASADGVWTIFLNPMKSNKKSQNMIVFENGKKAKDFANVLIGEVWIAGGQSNLQWELQKTSDYKSAKAEANSMIRIFSMPQWEISPKREVDLKKGASWRIAASDNIGNTQAVAYYFAWHLQKDLKVPVAIVETALGGASMRAYIPDIWHDDIPFLKSKMDEFKRQREVYDYGKSHKEWKARVESHKAELAKAKAQGKTIAPLSWRDRTEPNAISPDVPQLSPAYLFNAKIAPIAGYTARGVVWYQGESEAESTPEAYESFQAQFTRLIESWRSEWGANDLYFAFVQLASFDSKNGHWAQTRWAQHQTMLSVPRTAMANIIDTGEARNIHPADKLTVGKRLEKIALRNIYGFSKVHPYGPVFKRINYTPRGAEILFNLDGRKLMGRGDSRGFEILCGDKWIPAKAELCGNMVVVNHKDNPDAKICGVRYLWKNYPKDDVWLFNEDGLPALSFISER